MLVYIKRKANNRTAETIKKLSKNNSNSSSAAQQNGAGEGTNNNQLSQMQSNATLDDDMYDGPDAISHLLPDELISETDAVLTELEQQRVLREEFERKIQAKMAQLESENQVLKRLFVESNNKTVVMQERMDKVLKTLYNVFLSNPQVSKTLLSRMPSLMIESSNFSSPKAIMDAGAVSRFVGSSSGSNLSHQNSDGSNGSTSNNMESSALTTGNLRRMASFDPYGFLNGSSATSNYLSLNNPLAGAELSAANRGTSFDFAAASVSAPLRYLPSFDGSVFQPSAQPSNNGDIEIGTESSRVTVLDDSPRKSLVASRSASEQHDAKAEAPQSGSKRKRSGNNKSNSADEIAESIHEEGSQQHANKLQRVQPDTFADPSDLFNETDDGLLLGPHLDSFVSPTNNLTANVDLSSTSASGGASASTSASEIPEHTREFLDLLQRNQNTTLCRLDSLEQTLATLLESMDDSYLGDIVSSDVPASASNDSNADPQQDAGNVGGDSNKSSGLVSEANSEPVKLQDYIVEEPGN